MRLDLFDQMYRIEKKYWWYKAKRNYVHLLLKKVKFQCGKGRKILDIGCGTGVLLNELKNCGDIYGLDITKEAVEYCKKRGIPQVKLGDINKGIPFKSKKFDLITMLDVIEHIDDDHAVMKTVTDNLNKNGLVIITTSAYPWMWSYWDEVAGHARRYTSTRLKDIVESSGLTIRHFRYTNMSVFPAALVFRFIKGSVNKDDKNEVQSDFIKVPNFVNSLLVLILKIEALIALYLPLPFGLSFIVVAQKTKDR